MTKTIKNDTGHTHEALLKSVLKSAPYGIITLMSIRDEKNKLIDFECIMANLKIEQILSSKKTKLIGRKLSEIMPKSDDNGLFNLYAAIVEKDMKDDFEILFVNRDGKKWYRINGVRFDDGLTLHFIDITDLKKIILDLSESEEKYRNLFEESLDPLFMMDENYKMLDVNPAFFRLFCFSQKEQKNIRLKDIFEYNNDLEQFSDQLEKDGLVEEFEVVLKNFDGAKKDCLIHCIPLYNKSNSDKVYLGVIRDITRRKKAEKELIFAEKLSTTGKLARIIAHEVRNPLTNINLALSELTDELPNNNSESFYLDLIRRNTSRIQSLTKDLLNSSKPRQLELEKRSLNQVIKMTLKLVRDRLELQDMQLVEKYEKELPQIFIDKDQLKVGLLNIFLNAAEAMEPGKGVLEVETKQINNEIRLRISDNGKGIQKEDINRIFDPFFSGKSEGSGLGLTTTKTIIQSHHGSMDVESAPGIGTVFTICFPV